MLHSLNARGLAGGRQLKIFGQFFYFLVMRLPDRHATRQACKDAFAICLDIIKATQFHSALVAFARLDALHNSKRRTVSERNLLMPAADAEDGLPCFVDYFKNSGEGF